MIWYMLLDFMDRWCVIKIAKPKGTHGALTTLSFFLFLTLRLSQQVLRKPVSRSFNQADKTVKDKNWTNEWQSL